MPNAYDYIYLRDAQDNLGQMFDYLICGCGLSASKAAEIFIFSEISRLFADGDVRYIAGMSGIELGNLLLDEHSLKPSPDHLPVFSRSPEYWAGWALAYYQWKRDLSFQEILLTIPFDEIVSMYLPYHEMDAEKFSDEMDRKYSERKAGTNLKIRRKRIGLSQSELAESTGISKRTIQQYEQRVLDINKAAAWNLYSLSKALFCSMEDLLEKTAPEA